MKKIITLLVAITISLQSIAIVDLINDGIAYSIIENGENENYYVAVTYSTSINYSGSVTIPKCFTITEQGTWSSTTKTYWVKKIGKQAFKDCTDLTGVVIPDGVTAIDSAAFKNCTSLKSITIPNSVKSIGTRAFEDCTNLMDITIGAAVNSCVFFSVFSGCMALKEVNIAWNNNTFSSIDGIVYNKQETELKYVPSGIEGSVTFANTMTSIPSYSALNDNPYITSITIPSSVTFLGCNVFMGCNNLDSIICLPSTPPKVGCEDAFSSKLCNGYISVPCESYDAYVNATGWKNFLSLTSNVVSGVKYRKTSDSTVCVAKNNYIGDISIPSEVEMSFYHCDTTQNKYKITTIEDSAFADCSDLTSITIPNTITYIGENAFANCPNLTTINYNAKNIPTDGGLSLENMDYNFWLNGSDNIETINIGDSVEVIPPYFLFDKSSIKNINIGPHVTEIGYAAFYSCSGIDSITIPSSVTEIGYYAFADCKGLKDIILQNATLGAYMFFGCNGLESITIPNSMKFIDEYAFSGCTNLETLIYDADSCEISKEWLWSGIKSVTIGNNVKMLPKYFLYEQYNLDSITIPSNITFIDKDALYAPNVTTINYNADSCYIPGTWLNSGYKSKNVNIGTNVRIIPNYFMCKQYGLSNIDLPDNIKEIGDSAFYLCALQEIILPESLKKIGNRAFADCYGLTNVTIPKNVSEFGWGTFSGCKSITDITFHNSIIGKGMFSNCSSLTKITIPSTITTIDDHAFSSQMNIDTVICEGSTPANLGENIFQYSNYGPYDITLIVPCGSKNTYETSDWKIFTNIKESCTFVTYTQELSASICDNETYTFFNKELSSSGIYTDTLHVNDTTDSIYILTLDVYSTFDTTVYDTIQQEGTQNNYNDTLISSFQTVNGCDSIITTITTYEYIKPFQTITQELFADICDNETYQFNDIVLMTSGMYYDTVHVDQTTDSVYILTLDVHQTYDTIIYDTTTIYDMAGENYEDIKTDTLQTINGCDSIVTTKTYYIFTAGLNDMQQPNTISVYPNPASAGCTSNSTLTIQGVASDIVIIDNKGQVIKTINNPDDIIKLDIKDFNSGVYYIKCKNITKKLVIE